MPRRPRACFTGAATAKQLRVDSFRVGATIDGWPFAEPRDTYRNTLPRTSTHTQDFQENTRMQTTRTLIHGITAPNTQRRHQQTGVKNTNTTPAFQTTGNNTTFPTEHMRAGDQPHTHARTQHASHGPWVKTPQRPAIHKDATTAPTVAAAAPARPACPAWAAGTRG